MQNLWRDSDAQPHMNDDLRLRVYTTQLLGRDPSLVLHGGGNTSVKTTASNFFGEDESIIFVKASGWDMATIQNDGFTALRMEVMTRLAALETLSDLDMVREQRAAMLHPDAPNPSLEALLHALIPYKYVDHTHADAVLALMNTPEGETIIRQVYGDRVLVVPYAMPGFALVQAVRQWIADRDWSRYDGMMLLNHGVFTFADDARESYDRMIEFVTLAEDYLQHKEALSQIVISESCEADLNVLSQLRRLVSEAAERPMIALLDNSPEACGFASRPDVESIALRGPLTPDHATRTRRVPVVLGEDFGQSIQQYVTDYQAYFARHAQAEHSMLDSAPRWAVWRGHGIVAFGEDVKRANIALDIVRHTIRVIQMAEGHATWQALSEDHIFDMEYWSLQQAKLKQYATPDQFEGQVALVTGAASGIGRAIAEMFVARGAAVIAVDINESVVAHFDHLHSRGMVCDLTDVAATRTVIETTVRQFGGLDILISNAGIFPMSYRLDEMDEDIWQQSMAINLTSHQQVIQNCIPFLKQGIMPTILVTGSKNYPAPGPGAGAYSVAKAGLTQLVRIAALELAPYGIRVNTIHPDRVMDTGIWTPEIIQKRAANYQISVEEYKTSNLLQVSISSQDVAELVAAMVGDAFRCTTGAQVPIDGGNERVI